MDEHERARLEEAHRIAHEAHGIASGIHRMLYGVPEGSDKSELPFIAWLRVIVAAWRRLSWLIRMVIYGVPTLAGVIIAAAKIAEMAGWTL